MFPISGLLWQTVGFQPIVISVIFLHEIRHEARGHVIVYGKNQARQVWLLASARGLESTRAARGGKEHQTYPRCPRMVSSSPWYAASCLHVIAGMVKKRRRVCLQTGRIREPERVL